MLAQRSVARAFGPEGGQEGYEHGEPRVGLVLTCEELLATETRESSTRRDYSCSVV